MPSTQQQSGVGIVIVTHGTFGQSLLEAALLVVGPQERVDAVGVIPAVPVDSVVESIRESVESCGGESGEVLVLTDLFGGTPTTLSLSLLKSYDLEVITGVNLPMLVKAFQCRTLSLPEMAKEAKSAGRQGIMVAGEVLKRKIQGGGS